MVKVSIQFSLISSNNLLGEPWNPKCLRTESATATDAACFKSFFGVCNWFIHSLPPNFRGTSLEPKKSLVSG